MGRLPLIIPVGVMVEVTTILCHSYSTNELSSVESENDSYPPGQAKRWAQVRNGSPNIYLLPTVQFWICLTVPELETQLLYSETLQSAG